MAEKVSNKRVRALERRVEDLERDIDLLKKAVARHNHDCDKKPIFDGAIIYG